MGKVLTVTFPVVATTFIVFVYTVIASFTDVRNVVIAIFRIV